MSNTAAAIRGLEFNMSMEDFCREVLQRLAVLEEGDRHRESEHLELRTELKDMRKLLMRIAILVAGGLSAPGVISVLGL